MENMRAYLIMLALSIGVVVLYNQIFQTSVKNQSDVRYGATAGAILKGAKSFAVANRSTILAAIAANGGGAISYSVANLQAAGALDPSISAITQTHGIWCLEFKSYNAGANLQGLLTVVGETAPLGDVDAGIVAANTNLPFTGAVDHAGNFVYPNGSIALSSFTGANACQPGANAFGALISDDDSLGSGTFLARVDTGFPTDRRMTADFDLGGNNLLNGNSVSGVTATFTTSVVTPLVDHTSDRRAKTDIRPIQNPYSLLRPIIGSRFRFKDSGRLDDGVIAQDVERSMPELVHVQKDGSRTVNYDGLLAPLIEEVKWQHRQIERDRATIRHLTHQLAGLSAQTVAAGAP